jgi:hypothetical protein
LDCEYSILPIDSQGQRLAVVAVIREGKPNLENTVAALGPDGA